MSSFTNMIPNIVFPDNAPTFDEVNFPSLSNMKQNNTNNQNAKNTKNDDEDYKKCLVHSNEFIRDVEEFVMENEAFADKLVNNIYTPNGTFYWDTYYGIDMENVN